MLQIKPRPSESNTEKGNSLFGFKFPTGPRGSFSKKVDAATSSLGDDQLSGSPEDHQKSPEKVTEQIKLRIQKGEVLEK